MLFNHSPIYVSTALDRLYNSITYPDRIFPKIHTNTWHKDMEPLAGHKRAKEEYAQQFCRIRKLKEDPK